MSLIRLAIVRHAMHFKQLNKRTYEPVYKLTKYIL